MKKPPADVFAELHLGKSYLRYLKNGKLRYSGWQGPQLFAVVMHHAGFFGHGDPLPAMAAMHKVLEGSTIQIHWENAPRTKLSELKEKLKAAVSPHAQVEILKAIHQAELDSQESQWETARKIVSGEDSAHA